MLYNRNQNLEGGHVSEEQTSNSSSRNKKPQFDRMGKLARFVVPPKPEAKSWKNLFGLKKKEPQYVLPTTEEIQADAEQRQALQEATQEPAVEEPQLNYNVKKPKKRLREKLAKKAALAESARQEVEAASVARVEQSAPDSVEEVVELQAKDAEKLVEAVTEETAAIAQEVAVQHKDIPVEAKLELAKPEAQAQIAEQIQKKTFFKRPSMRSMVEFVGGMAAGAAYKNVATSAMRKALRYGGVAHGAGSWASMGISAGIGAAVGGSFGAGREYFRERQRVKAEQKSFASELEGKVGSERLALLLKYRTEADMKGLDEASREILEKYDNAKVNKKKIAKAALKGALIGGVGGAVGDFASKFLEGPHVVHADSNPVPEVHHVATHSETIVPKDIMYVVQEGDKSVWRDMTIDHLHKAGIAHPSNKLITEVTRMVLDANKTEIVSDHAANLAGHHHFEALKDITMKVGDQVHHWEVANDLIRDAGGNPDNFNIHTPVPDMPQPHLDMQEFETYGYRYWPAIAVGYVAMFGGANAYALYKRRRRNQEQVVVATPASADISQNVSHEQFVPALEPAYNLSQYPELNEQELPKQFVPALEPAYDLSQYPELDERQPAHLPAQAVAPLEPAYDLTKYPELDGKETENDGELPEYYPTSKSPQPFLDAAVKHLENTPSTPAKKVVKDIRDEDMYYNGMPKPQEAKVLYPDQIILGQRVSQEASKAKTNSAEHMVLDASYEHVPEATPEISSKEAEKQKVFEMLDAKMKAYSDFVKNRFARLLRNAVKAYSVEMHQNAVDRLERVIDEIAEPWKLDAEWEKKQSLGPEDAYDAVNEWNEINSDAMLAIKLRANNLEEKYTIAYSPDSAMQSFQLLKEGLHLIDKAGSSEQEGRIILEALKSMEQNGAGQKDFEKYRDDFFQYLVKSGHEKFAKKAWAEMGLKDFPFVSQSAEKAPYQRQRVKQELVQQMKDLGVTLEGVSLNKYAELLSPRSEGGRLWAAVDAGLLSESVAMDIQQRLGAIRNWQNISKFDTPTLERILSAIPKEVWDNEIIKPLRADIVSIDKHFKAINKRLTKLYTSNVTSRSKGRRGNSKAA